MLKLFKYINIFPGNNLASIDYCCAVLDEACNIKTAKEINGDYTLEFDFPCASEKSGDIKENYIVECCDERYKIVKISRENNGSGTMHVSCVHIFHFRMRSFHIQSFGGTAETIGQNPYDIFKQAIAKTGFSALSYEELEELGMKGIGADGFLIDFETVDKTTPYDIIQQIIANCGKGEVYIENHRCAIVERIGSDNGMRLDITHNMQNVTIERDISNMITRLYPYGKDDAHIGSVNGGQQYIESENVKHGDGNLPGYGIIEGYKDYSEYTDPSVIMSRAEWEFDPNNADRIDVPDINITGSFIDLSKISGSGVGHLELGDTVYINDNGTKIAERVIKIEEYPFEPLETTVSIGRIKKDLFFYLKQMGKSVKQTARNSTSNGKISAQAVSGTITANITSDKVSSSYGAITAEMGKGCLAVKKGNLLKCRIGSDGSNFAFDVYDNRTSPVRAIYMTNNGMAVEAAEITIGNAKITSDADGNLLINGKKILTKE